MCLTRDVQSLPSTVLRRVMRELSELKKSPPEGIRIQTSEEDMLDVTGIIQGPGESSTAGSRVTMTRSSMLAPETHGAYLSVA